MTRMTAQRKKRLLLLTRSVPCEPAPATETSIVKVVNHRRMRRKEKTDNEEEWRGELAVSRSRRCRWTPGRSGHNGTSVALSKHAAPKCLV